MGLKDYFRRKSDPSTEGLQRAGAKRNKPMTEIILPPRDENGRFVPDNKK